MILIQLNFQIINPIAITDFQSKLFIKIRYKYQYAIHSANNIKFIRFQIIEFVSQTPSMIFKDSIMIVF